MGEVVIARRGQKRIRSEECEVLRVASLRWCVEPQQEHVVLADGTELYLRRTEVRGVFTARGTRGTALTLMAQCPTCRRAARVLRKPYGTQQWGCRRCLPLIYPAQRRSGWHKGQANRKPSTWHLAAIGDEQRKIARMLALPCWPPQKIIWDRSQLQPDRKLPQERKTALTDRLEALETLRIMTCATAFGSRFGISELAKPTTHLPPIKLVISTTQWAVNESWRRRRGQSPELATITLKTDT